MGDGTDTTVDEPEEVRAGFHHRACAWMLAHLDPTDHRLYGERKSAMLGDVRGRVLDVRAGAGVHLEYLDSGVDYVAVEPNVRMQTHFR